MSRHFYLDFLATCIVPPLSLQPTFFSLCAKSRSSRAVSSGKTLSSFVRSAVHIADFRLTRVSCLCLIDAFFRQPPRLSLLLCLSFPFVHASSRALTTLHALSCSRKVSRFISLQTIPTSIVFLYQLPLFYLRLPAATLSLSRFNTHFFAFPLSFDSLPSRPLSRPFVISLQPSRVRFCFTNPLCHYLSFSVSNPPSPRVSLFNVTLCAVSSFFNHRSLALSTTLSTCPASFSLSLSSYLPPTHAHPPPSSSAGSVRIGPAR